MIIASAAQHAMTMPCRMMPRNTSEHEQATRPYCHGMGFILPAPGSSYWGHGGQSYGIVATYYTFGFDAHFVCPSTRDWGCTRLMAAWRVTGLAGQ